VASDTDTGWDVYRFDRVTGSFDLVTVSATGGGSDAPGRWNGLTIDGDGRYVAFTSDSTTLVANDPDPNGTVTDAYGHTITLWAPGRAPDVFLRDMVLGTTTLISTGPNGGAAMGASPDITPDGRYIAFEGGYMVTGFPDHEIMVYDRTTGTSELDGLDASGHRALGSAPSISADGNVVVFANSDPAARLTPDAPINSDGQALHLYARNRSAGTTELVDTNAPDLTTDRAPAMGTASLSADGRYVAFGCSCQRVSSGPNPGQGHLGIYRADLSTGAVVEVDANLNGVVADRDSYAEYTFQAITGDGASILFGTTGNNLVTFDDNDHADIFVSTPT
jgi:Tol biopolymer transport system component